MTKAAMDAMVTGVLRSLTTEYDMGSVSSRVNLSSEHRSFLGDSDAMRRFRQPPARTLGTSNLAHVGTYV